jgi:hypothetical protein
MKCAVNVCLAQFSILSSIYVKTAYNPTPQKVSGIDKWLISYLIAIIFTVAFGMPSTNFTSEFEYREIVMISIAGCVTLFVAAVAR